MAFKFFCCAKRNKTLASILSVFAHDKGSIQLAQLFEQLFVSCVVVTETVTVAFALHLQGLFGYIYGDEGVFFSFMAISVLSR